MYSQQRPDMGFPRYGQPVKNSGSGCGSCLGVLTGIVLGIIIGIVAVIGYIAYSHDVTAPASQGAAGNNTLEIQLSQAYLSKLAEQNIHNANLPGTISNVQVKTSPGAPVVITANEQVNVFGLAVTKPLTVNIQPYVQDCQLRVRVTHVDLAGIPLTTFASALENQLNQQPTVNNSTLPRGFKYCATNTHTDNTGVFVTFSATPVP